MSGLPSLELTPLQPQRCDFDLCCLRPRMQNRGFILVHNFRSTLFSSWKVGILLFGFWVLVKELPLVFIFILTISMPTVKYPLYFRYVLNSLYLFLVLCFCFKKKEKKEIRRSPHLPPCLCTFIEETGCHFTISATFPALPFASVFGRNVKWTGRGGDNLWASVVPECATLHC